MKRIISFILVLTMLLSFAPFAFAECKEWTDSGVYDLEIVSEYAGNISITPQKAGKDEAASTSGLYVDAERFQIDIADDITTENKYYMVFMLASGGGVANTVPTVDNIVYIDQQTGTTSGVEFNAYPSELVSGYEYKIYVSTNDTTENKLNGYQEIASLKYYQPYILGDVVQADGDKPGTIDISDAMAIINWIVGKIELTPTQMLAANADGKGSVDISDAMAVINLIVGKIDHLGL